jgi:hypothetical protein
MTQPINAYRVLFRIFSPSGYEGLQERLVYAYTAHDAIEQVELIGRARVVGQRYVVERVQPCPDDSGLELL